MYVWYEISKDMRIGFLWVCVCVYMCVYVYICVYERDRERGQSNQIDGRIKSSGAE